VKILFFLSILLVAGLSFSFTPSGSGDWVKLGGSGPFVLTAHRGISVLQIPLVLSDFQNPERLRAKLASVQLNNQFDAEYDSAITVGVLIKGGLAWVTIKATLSSLTSQGTYLVNVIFSDSADLNKQAVPITISLTRPAAQLETTKPLHINIDGTDVTSDPLTITETGGQSGIMVLEADAPAILNLNGINLFVFKKGSTISVGANHTVGFCYDIDPKHLDDIPLGDSHGGIRLTAPELAAPVTIDVVIHRNRTKWLIVLMVFAGVMMSGLVKQLLTNQRAITAARSNGFDLLLQIERQKQKIRCQAIEQKLSAISTTLEAVLQTKYFPIGTKSADTITNATSAAQIAYNQVKIDLDAEVKTIGDQVHQCLQAFGPNITSIGLGFQLTSIRDTCTSAKSAFERLDLDETTVQLNRAVILMGQFVIKYGQSLSLLQANLSIYLPGFVPNPPLGLLQTSLTNAQTVVNGLGAINDTAGGVAAIRKVNDAQYAMEQAESTIVDYADRMVMRVTQGTAVQLGALRGAFSVWKSAVNQSIQDGFTGLGATEFSALTAAWNAIGAVSTPLPPSGGKSAKVGLLEFEASTTSAANYPEGISQLQAALDSSIKYWWVMTIVQGLIVSVLLGLAAVLVYGSKFTGDLDGLLSIFFVGFGLDITSSSVVQLSQKKV
jgi:hypothetical protein